MQDFVFAQILIKFAQNINLITFAQISPQFFPNLINFIQKNLPKNAAASLAPTALNLLMKIVPCNYFEDEFG